MAKGQTLPARGSAGVSTAGEPALEALPAAKPRVRDAPPSNGAASAVLAGALRPDGAHRREERETCQVLVFGPIPKAGRTTSVSTVVHEALVREAGSWRIRVW